jgi:hypothetical protein
MVGSDWCVLEMSILQSFVVAERVPWMMGAPLRVIVTAFEVKVAVHPWSHN